MEICLRFSDVKFDMADNRECYIGMLVSCQTFFTALPTKFSSFRHIFKNLSVI